MRSLFDVCVPREDVRTGHIRESDFAADLAQVLRQDADTPDQYKEAGAFFANTYPTEGLKALLSNVGKRLTGAGGATSAIFRLDTQYGGGKTHGLIALTHLAHGMNGVTDPMEFIDPALVPRAGVQVAAFDGENAEPISGRHFEGGVTAYTPWGEIAYGLGGIEGYERVQENDIERVPPGADTLRALFGGKPTLILVDELSVYLRAVRGRKEEGQFTLFMTNLCSAVESSARAALVLTVAIGKDGATDAYQKENEYVAREFEEIEHVLSRKATVLDPTAEREAAKVLRRRLFAKIDEAGAAEIVDEYAKLWNANRDLLPPESGVSDRVQAFRDSFPFHPGLMDTLTGKLATLENFQRVRGMLRLLTRTVGHLWDTKPGDAHAIHLHHMDPALEPIRNEALTRLRQQRYAPAVDRDVIELAGEMDARHYAGLSPYASYVARNVLWHTFAFNDRLRGVERNELRFSALGPGMDVGFIDDAAARFADESAYMDDRPGVPMRFRAEANLTQLIRQQTRNVDPDEARAQLRDRIIDVFSGKDLAIVPFPSAPGEVADDVGDGRPRLVVVSYDAETVSGERVELPRLVKRLHQETGSQQAFRRLRNNVVFLVADAKGRDDMRDGITRRLALGALTSPDRLAQLADHQQDRVKELYQRSEQEITIAIQQAYRHLFYPARTNTLDGSDLAHMACELPLSAEKPGDGQRQALRALGNAYQLLRSEDDPMNPSYVNQNTPMKNGQMSTAGLRGEFRGDPGLPIMLGNENFVKMVRTGIDQGAFVYQHGDLLYGPGDAWAEVKIDENAALFTVDHATEVGIWPRPDVRPEKPTEDHPPDRPPKDHGPFGPPTTVNEGGPATFHGSGALREALNAVWDKARHEKASLIGTMEIELTEPVDALRMIAALRNVRDADCAVQLRLGYQTGTNSSVIVEFTGDPEDAQNVREFLNSQIRAAKSTSVIKGVFTLTFPDGLSTADKPTQDLTKQLTVGAPASAGVSATAKAKA